MTTLGRTSALQFPGRLRRRWLRWRLFHDPVGFNFFGSVTGNLGVGVAARNTLTTLRLLGYPVEVTDVDVDVKSGRSRQILTHGTPGDRSADRGRHPVNMFHINPPWGLGLVWEKRGLAQRDHMNVCVPFWELEDLPEDWVTFLSAMDVVLAPTAFIESAVRSALPDAAIVRLPQSVPDLRVSGKDRQRWNLPNDAVVFLSAFDVLSDLARKNPSAAIAAFRSAFPGRDDVRLVLKIQPLAAEFSAKRDELQQLVGGDPRIMILEARLSVEDLAQLMNVADVYVSLHRSEGLGLGMMESLTLGIPVLATAYSGPLDFITAENSELIPFTRVPVDSDLDVYQQMSGISSWAEPDHGSAMAAMRRLADDASLRRRLGRRGMLDMKLRRDEVESGVAIRRLVDTLRSDPVRKSHEEKRRIMRSFARPRFLPVSALRHVAAVTLKRLVGIPWRKDVTPTSGPSA